jgi:hypothetical protein
MSAAAAASSGAEHGHGDGAADASSASSSVAAPAAKSRADVKIDSWMDGGAGSGLLAQIEALKKEQADARKHRQKLARDLRNATRRKRRLKSKARMLSNEDLVEVLVVRRSAGAEGSQPDGEPFAADPPLDDEEGQHPEKLAKIA